MNFLQFTSSGSASITYFTEDSVGNRVEKTITVYIVDLNDTTEGNIGIDGSKCYTRFISKKYLKAGVNYGGLEETSVWRMDAGYIALLSAVLNNRKSADGNWASVVQTWEFTKQDIMNVKDYVHINGIGSSKYMLDRFIAEFENCKSK